MIRKPWLAALLFLCTLVLYVRTLAPSVAFLFDDSLEFQLVGFKLAIAHPTGYPLYTLLLKLSAFLPFGDVAYRANLLSAIFAALSVALVYLIVSQLTASTLASLVAALALAISPVFWSQAVIAEVYALNALFVAAIILVVVRDRPSPQPLSLLGRGTTVGRGEGRLMLLAFLLGLALTHHRTIILLAPALLIFQISNFKFQTAKRCFSIAKSKIKNLKSEIVHAILAFLLPFTLYLYIPLRGAVGSLDGSYQNTLEGFVRWITASHYNIFLTSNPFHEQRDAKFFFDLFLNQFGWLGLALSVIGFVAMSKPIGRRQSAEGRTNSLQTAYRIPPTAYFLFVAFLTFLAFVLVYRVPDIEVFAIPAFLSLAIALGCGLHIVLSTLSGIRSHTLRRAAVIAVFILLGVNFVPLFQASLAQNDLSGKTDVRDYGRDILAQPLPANATLVGILGEMTLVRYFQATEGLNPTLVTIAADRDDERMAAVEHELGAGRAVFTTRPLNGLAEKYSLGAFGPLVRIWPAPPTADLPADAPRVDAIKYRKDGIVQPATHLVRAQVSWQPTAPINTDLKISARLMDGEKVVAQKDDWPVRNAYHTQFWRTGELIQDVYDLIVPADAPAKTYRVLLIVYRAKSGEEIGRVDCGEVAVKR